jgi:hypothetical protein
VCPVDADEIWAGPSAWSDDLVMRFRSGRWKPVDDVSLRSGWAEGTSCDGALAGASDGAMWVQRQACREQCNKHYRKSQPIGALRQSLQGCVPQSGATRGRELCEEGQLRRREFGGGDGVVGSGR